MQPSHPDFTIIIPVVAVNDYLREAAGHIVGLDDAAWELIVVVDEMAPSEWTDPRVRLMASGRAGPATKRDMAAQVAQGKLLVFLDDDSYPRKDLLSTALPFFADSEVVAIGGPAITPPEDGFWQRVSGTVFLSRFSGGAPERYVPLGQVRTVQDWPSVNFIVRKASFLAIGGFDSHFWPGEDTKLCLEFVKTGKKILYVPDLVVWHHRRSSPRAHFKQVGAYGLHRGFFAKRYPETSLKLRFLAPSSFVTLCVLTLLSIPIGFPGIVRALLAVGWVLYALALLKAFSDFNAHVPFTVAVCALPYTVCTHLVYGVQFIRGLASKALVSELREAG